MAFISSAFTAGQTLTAASMEDLRGNANAGHSVFTTEAARDAAITAPTEGLMAYLTAPTSAIVTATGATTAIPTGITTIYNGSAWVCTTPVAALSNTSATTTSGTYVSTLTGDSTAISATLPTGTTAFVLMNMRCTVAAVATVSASISVSGATTITAAASAANVSFAQATGGYAFYLTYVFPFTGLTAGINTFTLNYATTASTVTTNGRSLTVKGIA